MVMTSDGSSLAVLLVSPSSLHLTFLDSWRPGRSERPEPLAGGQSLVVAAMRPVEGAVS